MVSVPRDLWVAIPGYGQERINAAYEFGGSQTAKQTVSNVLAQPVDRYALIGLQGVRDVVNAVGGVDITVAQAIHDDTYPTDDYGYQTVDIPAGRQHMDGDMALNTPAPAIRTATSHGSRASSRSCPRCDRPCSTLSTGRVSRPCSPRCSTRSRPTSAHSTPSPSARRSCAPRAIQTVSSSIPRSPTRSPARTEPTLLQARPELKLAVARFLGSSSSTPATVDILNGGGVVGLASRTADKLSQRGFVVSSVGDAPRTQAQTTIVARPGWTADANQIATALSLPTSRVSEGAASPADIEVTLGADVH